MPAPKTRLLLLLGLTLVVCALFMTVGLRGRLSYVLAYRAQVMAAMVLVAVAVGASTVVFQTLTRNRILTPSVMGFDALFVLVQTAVIFFLGTGGWTGWPPLLRFGVETALMVGFACLLYRWMLSGPRRDLYRLLLAGLVCGILFRSLSELMQRMLAPTEFSVLQGRLFAQLTLPAGDLTLAAGALVPTAGALLWRSRRELDVMALGRETAVALGVGHDRVVTRMLILIAVMVSASTALIGPLTFLGFVAATLAYQLAGTTRHAVVLPFTTLLAVVALAGGQMVLEYGFGMAGTLSVVIEFAGGSLFLWLLVRKGRM